MKLSFMHYVCIWAGMVCIALILSFFGCKKDSDITPTEITDLEDLYVDPSFTFLTTNDVSISVRMLDNENSPVAGLRVDIYTADPDSGGQRLLSGITDNSGYFKCDYRIPAYLKSLVVGTNAIGFVNRQSVLLIDRSINCVLGGKEVKNAFKNAEEGIFKSTNSIFIPMGTYNNKGVPNYLASPNDVIDATMIQDINATLPEYSVLPNTHPQYFVSSTEQNLVLDEACNVWVTFVHEGAGYTNTLGYYKYNANDPPTSVADIDSVHIIFPNTSFNGSGGGLYSGNRVYLGQFAPGTELGWVLIANGFQNGTITNGSWMLYSNKEFNPEPNASQKQHFILCNDIGRGRFLLGVEDLKRNQGSDNDFNDAVFYVSADPIQAVDVSHVPLPDYTQSDSDHDGVPDNFDDYPSDASKAFNNYYPAQNSFGSLVFEDSWPSRGDYDFNDMVLDYHFNQITNGSNNVVKVDGKCVLRAMGAGYENGFGIQLPILPAQVSSFTGSRITGNDIELMSNGTEAGQSKATLILFNNGYSILPHMEGAHFVNTTPGDPYREPDTLSISFQLTSPVALSQMGVPPYNPFIFIDQVRSREAHLINQPPTSKANMSLFGTEHDNSYPSSGRYYVTSNNLPWGIDVIDKFDYTVEKVPVNFGYTKFVPWSLSSGQQYYDWFQNVSGYRNTQNIYNR
jgi:LruC domain-containing protein